MNPTAQNISTAPSWRGLRAPWIGTKNVWHFFHILGLLPHEILREIQDRGLDGWTPRFATEVYEALAARGAYVTNLAKCTQRDARPLKNSVFRAYRDILFREISMARPQHIITLGNQVSSVVLGRSVSVSDFKGISGETLRIGNTPFFVFPTYYPVGQGRRNLPRSIERISAILA